MSTVAGLPPTTSKVSGDSTDITTFKYRFPNFTGTRSGTTIQLDVNSIAGGGTNSSTALNNNRVIVSSSGAIVESSTIDTTELSYLNNVTSNIQTQLDAKAATRCVLVYSDQQTVGTNGGTSFVAFTQRNLTTENYDNCNLGTLSSNRVTLSAGTYSVNACAPAYKGDWHQIRLWNVTTAAAVIYGQSAYADSANEGQTHSCLVNFVFTANGTDQYSIQHAVTNAVATNGWGVRDASAVGGGERFAIVTFEKM